MFRSLRWTSSRNAQVRCGWYLRNELIYCVSDIRICWNLQFRENLRTSLLQFISLRTSIFFNCEYLSCFQNWLNSIIDPSASSQLSVWSTALIEFCIIAIFAIVSCINIIDPGNLRNELKDDRECHQENYMKHFVRIRVARWNDYQFIISNSELIIWYSNAFLDEFICLKMFFRVHKRK